MSRSYQFPEQTQPLLEQQDQNEGFLSKIAKSVDIFSFMPVPRTTEVTTKRSQYGSLFMFFVFFIYLISSFYQFLTHNTPRINQVMVPLPDTQIVKAQDFAISFIYGNDLDQSFLGNSSSFYFTLQQVTQFEDSHKKKIYKDSVLKNCTKDQIPWIGDATNLQLLCPQEDLFLQGQIQSSPVHQYARIVIYSCNFTNETAGCIDQNSFNRYLGEGRIFLYMRKPAVTDYSTGDVYPEGFQLLNYYLIPGLYQRNELVMLNNKYIIQPDLFTTFSTQTQYDLLVGQQKYYLSKPVVDTNPLHVNWTSIYMCQIWFRLDESVYTSTIVYDTIIDNISKWGAIVRSLYHKSMGLNNVPTQEQECYLFSK